MCLIGLREPPILFPLILPIDNALPNIPIESKRPLHRFENPRPYRPTKGITLVSASTLQADFAGFEGTKTEAAKKVGELIAEKAKAAGITAVVFDRGGNKYTGRVAAVADGAREGGLAL